MIAALLVGVVVSTQTVLSLKKENGDMEVCRGG